MRLRCLVCCVGDLMLAVANFLRDAVGFWSVGFGILALLVVKFHFWFSKLVGRPEVDARFSVTGHKSWPGLSTFFARLYFNLFHAEPFRLSHSL